MITLEGGLKAYLGTGNIDEIAMMLEKGDEKAGNIIYTMAYQLSKEIAAMYAVLEGEVDAIILSGEIFTIPVLSDNICKRVDKLGSIVVFGTVNDMDALAANGLMILSGEADWKEYK